MQSTCGCEPAGKVLISNIFHLFVRPMFALLRKLHGAHLHLVTVRVRCVRGRRICLVKSDSGYLATRPLYLCISNIVYSTSWSFGVICIDVTASCKLTRAFPYFSLGLVKWRQKSKTTVVDFLRFLGCSEHKSQGKYIFFWATTKLRRNATPAYRFILGSLSGTVVRLYLPAAV